MDEDGYLNFVVVESDMSSSATGRIPLAFRDAYSPDQFIEFSHVDAPRLYRSSGNPSGHPSNRPHPSSNVTVPTDTPISVESGWSTSARLPPTGSLLFSALDPPPASPQPWTYVETY
jgi:hypothetical protein